jgi:uncharacterized protein (TIGR02145 family)
MKAALRTIIIILFILHLKIENADAQVSFNDSGTESDSSAILDISSTTKGFLIPRMTSASRSQISSPAIGLLIYQTDNEAGFYFYSEQGWEPLATSCGQPVYYEGFKYETVKFGSQCWFKDNLRLGSVIAYVQSQSDNGIIEKYCYNDNYSNCLVYGGLYTWNEMMAWSTDSGGQGICPPGWRLPTDEDWKELEGCLDYHYGVGDSEWDNTGPRGYNAGYSIKTISTWNELDSWDNARADFTGFKARAGGFVNRSASLCQGQGYDAYFWTSSLFGNSAWSRHIRSYYQSPGDSAVIREAVDTTRAYSVRCVKAPEFDCFPLPTDANAGTDQLNNVGLSVTLQGNEPVTGAGKWNIISGTGGNISDPYNPSSAFSGIEGTSYTLRWTISACKQIRDDVVISFACPTANAGPDQLNLSGTSTSLAGNTPWAGAGQWTITGGLGGSITNPSDPLSLFTGTPGVTYTLRWTVTSNCTTVHDDVLISFVCSPQPTQANAGPDQSNIAGVTTTLQGNAPVYGTGTWTIANGANGIIAQPNNPSTTFTGTNGTTYILLWTISNSCGSTNDNVSISYAAFSCGNTFQDTRDGHVYTTLTRGAQCWMKQNLNYATGTSVCYAGNPTNCDNYGRLYDWNTASTACPTGWHLPTDAQWCTLLTGIDGTVSCGATGVTGTDAGGKMKETGTTYWQAPNTGATNSSGFSARGGGTTTIPGHNLNQWVSFWTATANGANYWSWEMTYNDARVWHTYYGWSNTMSVRCLKN